MRVSRKVSGMVAIALMAVVVLLGWYGATLSHTDRPPIGKEEQAQEEKKAVPDNEQATKDQERTVPRERLRYGGKSFAEWHEQFFTDLKPEVRMEVLKAMGAFGANGYTEEAAKVILDAMRTYDMENRDADDLKVIEAAQQALRKIGPPALPFLVAALKDRNRNVRLFAVDTLGKDLLAPRGFGPGSIPALTQAAKDDDPKIRLAVLARFGEHPRGDIPSSVFIEAAKDKDAGVRQEAISYLGRLIDRGFIPIRGVLPVLIEATKDQEARVRTSAVGILARVSLRDLELDDCIRVVRALGDIGPAAREAVPALRAASRDEDPALRAAALEALKKIDK